MSLADITAFPHVRLLQRVDDRAPGKGIARDMLPPKVATWMNRIEALPYYSKTTPPPDHEAPPPHAERREHQGRKKKSKRSFLEDFLEF